MTKIRVLIVDDSVVVRRLVTEELSSDPGLEVVGTAPHGRIGLAKIAQLKPDLVLLDVEMPEMDGLEALRAIRAAHGRLPVIMFSTLTQRGASATLDALTLGADDYVAKPANVGGLQAAQQKIREELIPRIKALGGRQAVPIVAKPSDPTRSSAQQRLSGILPPMTSAIEVIVVGVSTGGPNALATFLASLPADFAVPILIVQHMPPMFTRLLAERLSASSKIAVREGAVGDAVVGGQAILAPGNFHMTVRRDLCDPRIYLDQGPPENSCRPAVDVLFRSAAQAYGSGVLAIVMTGMGHDGFRGCEAIRAFGGQVIAQDEASSVVWGMPGYVVRGGLADAVVSLGDLGPAIARRVAKGRELAKAPQLN